MTIQSRASSVLSETEGKLRQLAAEAASSGDYAAIIKVAAWAKAVGDLIRSASPESRQNPTGTPRKLGRGAKKSGAASRSPAPSETKAYPRFYRRGDQLIRVAWSKRDKKEYLHKSPRSAISALVSALMKVGREGRVFSTDELLPLTSADDGAEIPNYQAYVCIAWLKHTALIEQHGRQGYSIPQLALLEGSVESVWQTLPQQ